MPADVVQRLLRNAENRTFQRRSQPLKTDVVNEVHLGNEPAVFVGQVFDRRNHAQFVQDRRTQAAK